ncbi:MAG TPA: T9SS type A sorting domain-containing protein, partial [Chitinophagaceae bacterium]|nr:T9SS type A sorting domain-containing protein [Chitinophagaceae bacterium]
ILLIAFLLFISSKFSFAQTFVGVSSSPADNGSNTSSTVTVTPPAGTQAGDLIVIYAQYRNTSGTVSISTTGGQTWTSETQYTGGSQRTRIFWCQFNGTWSANPVVGGGSSGIPLSAVMYVYRPVNSSDIWNKHQGPTNANTTNTIVSVAGLTNTVNNTVTMAFWGSRASTTWGTLTGAGWSKSGLGSQYRNTGGSGQSTIAAYQIMSAAGATGNVSQTQSSSQTTATSIISWYEAPSNDACSGATLLTSDINCTNTAGNVFAATNEAPTITGDCAGSVIYDVWYKFVAQTMNPTITLSNIGTDFTNPGMELLTGSCGSQTAIACGTTSIAATFLSPGTTYYLRVYSSSGSAPTSPTNAGFDICIVDPVATPPFNDECANAINLPIWNTCNNVGGNMAGATLSSGVPLSGCTGTVISDVWYKFIAVTNNTATISLSSLGTNFTSTGLQVFSGTCGSLTSIACNNGTSVTTPALTIGTTYYIRVFSTAASVPNGNARFNICATTTNAPVRFGNSYVNISKKTTGGVVQPGDTLEIRFTVNHTSGTMTNLRYVDDVPTNTAMLTGASDRIRIITNEGLAYKEYTLAGGDDAATYKASPGAGEYNIRMNVGFASGSAPNAPTVMTNASTSANGQMASTDKPKGGGGLLFAIAYRVVVTGAVGDTVTLFPAQFIYNNGSDVTLTATPFKILISNPMSLCANNIGLNNAVENGGTFGSGTSLTRSTDLTTPISGYTFIPDVSAYPAASGSISTVGDGRYSIVKNNSPKSSSYANAGRANNCPSVAINDPSSCTNRMFGGHWDVAGDHSGTNNAAGNAPPDINTSAGYMLEVNADYVASEVYRQTITNLCPNTNYEFSAWVKNICHTCGADSTGAQFAGTPTAPTNGYPGVLPNLTFTLDDLDYYNTGEIDTVGWLKRGFVFKTAPGQTTATFSIRNNAQGGGGNDWALDDIAIATCLPSMQYSPSITPMVCQGNTLQIYDTVRSYFDNYTNFKWQRSTNAGGSWNDITSPVDTSLVYNGSNYQFITKYTIPPANTTLSDSADLYRVVVATTSTNLSNSSCLYTDASTIITLSVNDCGQLLGLDLLSFNGKINDNGNAELHWVTSKENQPVYFNVEKSTDGVTFSNIATITGHGDNAENNSYNYTDPAIISGKVWYRIVMYNEQNYKKYSRTILLNGQPSEFSLNNVVNPFSNELDFEISISQNSKIDVVLTNLSGKQIRKESFIVYEGVNDLKIQDTGNLPPGLYILQVKNKDLVINKKVMKK